jgi:hypothetical protein
MAAADNLSSLRAAVARAAAASKAASVAVSAASSFDPVMEPGMGHGAESAVAVFLTATSVGPTSREISMHVQRVIERLEYLFLLGATIVLAAGTALRAAELPSVAGTYKDDRISITLQPDNPLDDTYKGTVTSGGKTYPLTAHARQGKLDGAFTDAAGTSFPFSATLDGGNLTFTTGSSTYHLTKGLAAATANKPADTQPQTAPAPLGTLRFQQLEVKDDPNKIGGTAFTCLIPEGWKSEGGVVWCPDVADPCGVRLRIFDPNSHSEVDCYPDLRFRWNERPVLGDAPQGSGKFDYGAVVEPMVDAPAALRKYVLPVRRPDLPADAKIVSCEDFPEYAKYTSTKLDAIDPNHAPVTAARAQIQYTQDGKAVEERVYCAIASLKVGTTVFWTICNIAGVKAEKGQLDAAVSLLTCTAHSVKLNEDWATKSLILKHYLIQQATAGLIRTTEQMNAFCNQQRARMTRDFEANMASSHAQFEKNMAAMDQQTQAMDQILTGVQNYTNPDTGRTLELPSNSQPVYFDSLSNTVQIGGDKPKDWTVLQPK